MLSSATSNIPRGSCLGHLCRGICADSNPAKASAARDGVNFIACSVVNSSHIDPSFKQHDSDPELALDLTSDGLVCRDECVWNNILIDEYV